MYLVVVTKCWNLKFWLSCSVSKLFISPPLAFPPHPSPSLLSIPVTNSLYSPKLPTFLSHLSSLCTFFKNIFLGDFSLFFRTNSALLHLPPLRFHCADGCWDRSNSLYCMSSFSDDSNLKNIRVQSLSLLPPPPFSLLPSPCAFEFI